MWPVAPWATAGSVLRSSAEQNVSKDDGQAGRMTKTTAGVVPAEAGIQIKCDLHEEKGLKK
jgi:hypothetical protein